MANQTHIAAAGAVCTVWRELQPLCAADAIHCACEADNGCSKGIAAPAQVPGCLGYLAYELSAVIGRLN
jgi:hypothetical protein